MKLLLLFLMLLSLALPAGAMQKMTAVEAETCGAIEGRVNCNCCEEGHCPCVAENEDSPLPALPAPAPSQVTAGEPIWAVCTGDFTLTLGKRIPIRKSAVLMATARALRAPPVPLYRWHCAMLW